MTDKIPITARGWTKIDAELTLLKSEKRPQVIKQIALARSYGDLSENAEYHAAREKQSFIEGRVQELESLFPRLEIVDPSKLGGDLVKFGATVTLIDEDSDAEQVFQLVGEVEADIDNDLLAVTAPLARALIGRRVGDLVHVTTPRGEKSYEILKISFC